MEPTINLGDKVRDRITGFTGIVSGITYWLYGCARAGVQPRELDKDGKVQEAVWFDVLQLELITEEAFTGDTRAVRTGGPRDDHSAGFRPAAG